MVIQTYDLTVAESPFAPVRFGARAGEIVGLLAPPGASQTGFFRALAGLDPPLSGSVRLREHPSRVVLVEARDPLEQMLADGEARVILVDGALDDMDPLAEQAAWRRLVRESYCGAAVVLGTRSAERAYRSDRLSLALWPETELVREFTRLEGLLVELIGEFSTLMRSPHDRRDPRAHRSIPGEMMRLTRVARDVARQASSVMKDHDEARRMRQRAARMASDRAEVTMQALVRDSAGEAIVRRRPRD